MMPIVSIRRFAAAFALLLMFLATGRAKTPPGPVAPVELHTASGGRVWVYLPPGIPANAKLACVLIPPAGSRLFHGMTLGDGDKAEHLPWLGAGFAVVSFDISGPVPEQPDDAQFIQAATGFMKAKFGVSDGLAALDATLAKYPQIDPKRLYVAGHSSAATLAVQLAAASERFKGCVAFAPIADVGERLKDVLPSLDRAIPGFADAIRSASPASRVDTIQCPVFLFHAEDDTNVPTASVAAFKDALTAHHKSVDYVSVASGEHYNSMIQQGIPKAIVWVKALDRKPSK